MDAVSAPVSSCPLGLGESSPMSPATATVASPADDSVLKSWSSAQLVPMPSVAQARK